MFVAIVTNLLAEL